MPPPLEHHHVFLVMLATIQVVVALRVPVVLLESILELPLHLLVLIVLLESTLLLLVLRPAPVALQDLTLPLKHQLVQSVQRARTLLQLIRAHVRVVVQVLIDQLQEHRHASPVHLAPMVPLLDERQRAWRAHLVRAVLQGQVNVFRPLPYPVCLQRCHRHYL
jgi:hypothetical protein